VRSTDDNCHVHLPTCWGGISMRCSRSLHEGRLLPTDSLCCFSQVDSAVEGQGMPEPHSLPSTPADDCTPTVQGESNMRCSPTCNIFMEPVGGVPAPGLLIRQSETGERHRTAIASVNYTAVTRRPGQTLATCCTGLVLPLMRSSESAMMG